MLIIYFGALQQYNKKHLMCLAFTKHSQTQPKKHLEIGIERHRITGIISTRITPIIIFILDL